MASACLSAHSFLTRVLKVYKRLKALYPQSDETIEAREMIRAAVIKRKK
jgi:hypothetical protein